MRTDKSQESIRKIASPLFFDKGATAEEKAIALSKIQNFDKGKISDEAEKNLYKEAIAEVKIDVKNITEEGLMAADEFFNVNKFKVENVYIVAP